MVHPVVQSDGERAKQIVEQLNELLSPDGWMLKPHKQMSGRPVYAPARTGTGGGLPSRSHTRWRRISTPRTSRSN